MYILLKKQTIIDNNILYTYEIDIRINHKKIILRGILNYSLHFNNLIFCDELGQAIDYSKLQEQKLISLLLKKYPSLSEFPPVIEKFSCKSYFYDDGLFGNS